MHPMTFYKLATACLVFGLLAPLVSAEERPQWAERRNSDAKPGVAVAKEPAEMVAKMLSEFDSDGDSLLNVRELTAMFTALRERSLKVRAGQSRAGRGEPNSGRRGLGARNAQNGQNQPTGGRPIQANAVGGTAANSKRLLREKSAKRRKRPVSDPKDGSEWEQRPGGSRLERAAAE